MVGSGDDRDGRDRGLEPLRPDGGDERGPADRPTRSLDAVLGALSDSRRRDILSHLYAGPNVAPAAAFVDAIVERETDRTGPPGRR